MSNLLDKASIILTPTAYNNGEALCVKPSDGSGDFDFSRNSAATRVNAQGLVENVQILSSNLVQNGDFSEEGSEEVSNGSFSQEGSELITNGDFSNGSTGWSKSTQVTIENGVANIISNDGSFQVLVQNNITTIGKSYVLTYTIVSNNDGGLKLGNIGEINSAIGTHSFYFVATETPINIARNSGITDISIDNISVREVGQDWTLTSGASIGENKLDINANAYDYFARQLDVSTIGKTYKVSVDAEIQSGRMILYLADTNAFEVIDASGSYTFYIVADGTQIRFRAFDASLVGSITNISVKEVGQNWDLQTGWQISNNKLNCLGASSQIEASTLLNFDITKKYKLVFTISGVDSGTRSFRVYTQGSNGGVIFSYTAHTNGTYEYYYDPSINGTKLAFQTAFNQSTFSIDDVSVIEITDDTNLPRINYEGFSYQDALGSEEIVNGGFDTNLNNWTDYGGTTISWESGGFALLDNDNGYWCKIRQSDVFEIGKTYRVILTAKSNIANKLFFSSTITGSFSQADTFETFEQYYTATTTTFEFGYHNVTGQNATITIDNVSVKEVLGQEVVPDSGCGSWLFEPQSTNLVTYSEDFTQWGTKTNISVTLNSAISPEGVNSAAFINENTSNAQHFIGQSFSFTNGQDVTISVYAKKNQRDVLQISPSSSYLSTNGYANYDLTNGLVTASGGGVTAEIETLTNDWYRCIAKFTANNSSTGTVAFFLQNSTTALRGASYQGDGTSGLYLWGAQVENLSYASSLIPTDGSTVTRNQDLCTNGGSLASINSTEGVIYWEGAKLQEASGTQVLGLSDGSGANRIGFQTSATANQIRFVVDAGGNQASKFFVLDDITDFNKLALKWKQDDFSFWVNGIKIGTDTSGNVPALNALNTLDFYYGTGNGTGIYNFTAKTKALAVWKEALSDEELTELTTI